MVLDWLKLTQQQAEDQTFTILCWNFHVYYPCNHTQYSVHSGVSSIPLKINFPKKSKLHVKHTEWCHAKPGVQFYTTKYSQLRIKDQQRAAKTRFCIGGVGG